MAPSKGAAHHPKGTARRPAVPRVVPAIPLNLPQKKRPGAANGTLNHLPNGVQKKPDASAPIPDIAASQADSSDDDKDKNNDDAGLAAITALTEENLHITANGISVRQPPKSDTASLDATACSSTDISNPPANPMPTQDSPQVQSPDTASPPAAAAAAVRGHTKGPSVTNGVNGTARNEPRHFPSQPISVTGPPPMHHPHPSNGSLVFGGFHDSNASSPAPPSSGGFMPPAPPPAAFHDTRPASFASHPGDPRAPAAVSGFMAPPPPHMIPFGAADFPPASTVDGYGRPIVAMAPSPFEPFQPFNESFNPSTPHSFHGSQPDQENGHLDRGASPNNFPPNAGSFPPPMMGRQMPEVDTGDGLMNYIMDHFGDPSTSDYTLQLRFRDDRYPPLRIPGHNLMFARSVYLKSEMVRQAKLPGANTGAMRSLVVHADDMYLRPDAFYMAVQRLYGFPLLPLAPPPGLSNDVTLAGNVPERFDFALAYAAAGALLKVPPVTIRGIEVVSHIVTWDTIEKAVAFALADSYAPDTFPAAGGSATPDAKFKYGPAVDMLMNGINNFIVSNFPPSFVLDTSAVDASGYSRIPFVPPPAPESPPRANGRSAPPIARGTKVRHGRTNSRFSGIQFGDINAVDPDNRSVKDKATVESTIMSRVLLNLPYKWLKLALESPAFNQTIDRNKLFNDVVNEREARRQRALSAIREGRLAESQTIITWLESGGSLSYGMFNWSMLGWVEEVGRLPETDLPCLSRKWFVELQSGSSNGVSESSG